LDYRTNVVAPPCGAKCSCAPANVSGRRANVGQGFSPQEEVKEKIKNKF